MRCSTSGGAEVSHLTDCRHRVHHLEADVGALRSGEQMFEDETTSEALSITV